MVMKKLQGQEEGGHQDNVFSGQSEVTVELPAPQNKIT